MSFASSFASRAGLLRVVAVISIVALTSAALAACSSGGQSGNAQSPNASAATSAGSANEPRVVSTKFITYPSSQGFEATVEALTNAAAANGMMIIGDVNQDAELSTLGLDLPGAHSFFVGHPQIGKEFFEATTAIGAVVPVRVHVWVDGAGPAHISYFDPAPQFTAVDPALSDAGQRISQSIRTIAEAAAGAGGPTTTAVETKFITVPAHRGFEATIGSLHDAAAKNGMTVLSDLNEETRLAAVGLQSQSAHSFFLGDPQTGKTLFAATQAIGAVVPVRVHVWSDDRGPALISYFDPAPLLTAIDPALGGIAQKISQAIRATVEAAAN